VTLETWNMPCELYLARGGDVNPYRPLLTGDVFGDADIPGVQTGGMGIIVSHPCSMRGTGGRLQEALLMAAVASSHRIGKSAWETGYSGLMPLPDLLESNALCVANTVSTCSSSV
jgi:hypothetical protein